jgi:hypothetical protein
LALLISLTPPSPPPKKKEEKLSNRKSNRMTKIGFEQHFERVIIRKTVENILH